MEEIIQINISALRKMIREEVRAELKLANAAPNKMEVAPKKSVEDVQSSLDTLVSLMEAQPHRKNRSSVDLVQELEKLAGEAPKVKTEVSKNMKSIKTIRENILSNSADVYLVNLINRIKTKRRLNE